MIFSSPLLFFTALMVFAFRAGGVTRAFGYTHSVLGLGFAAIARFSGRYPILILAGDGGIASVRVDGSFCAIGALGYNHSILGFGFAPVAGLSGCDSVLILVGDSSIARFRFDRSGSFTIFANGLTA